MRCLTLFYLQSCWDSHTWTYIIRGLQNIYIPSLYLSKMLIHFQSPWNITHVLAFPSFCPGPNTLLQDCTLSRTFLRHGTSIKMPVAWVLVNNERHVRTCGRKKSFVFVLFVSGKPRDWPFSTSRLSFYEDNDDPRVILLASLQALRGSQPDAFTFLCLSFENMLGHIDLVKIILREEFLNLIK